MFFKNMKTVEEIKAEYRRLAKLLHPDIGGSTEAMQKLNAEYIEALKSCNGQQSTDETGKTHAYKFDEEKEREIMAKIHDLLKIKMEAEIYLIGRWIWIIGKTKPVKEALKKEGCQWHSKRECWFWRSPEDKSRSQSKHDLGGLASKYGVNVFQQENETPRSANSKRLG